MAFDSQSPAQRLSVETDAALCVEAHFTADVFGPVKCLQLFAALNVLPDRFLIERMDENNTWRVHIIFCETSDAERIRRVLAKIAALPTAMDVRVCAL